MNSPLVSIMAYIRSLIILAVLLPHLTAQNEVSPQTERLKTASKAKQLADLSPEILSNLISPFSARKEIVKEIGPEVPDGTKATQTGLLISQALNPTGVLRLGGESYLMFSGSNKLKVGDAHSISIGKESHIIQITRIGKDDFEFKFKDQTFSRLIKVK